MNIFNICLGHQVDLYQALAGGRSLTAAEIAAQAGAHEGAIRGWLQQQVSTGRSPFPAVAGPPPGVGRGE